jgi:uncharacterized protein
MNTKVGIAWRPQIALLVEEESIEFTEIIAENYWNSVTLPEALERLVERGVTVIPHGISLSLGSADEPEKKRLEKMAKLAQKLNAPYVSEHIAFVRGAGHDSNHLLPVERTEEMLEIVVENIRIAQKHLPVPLVLENIACVFDWEDGQMTEGEFIRRIVEETDVGLLLDVANLYANSHNFDRSHHEFLDTIPLHKVEYVHVAGGVHKGKLYHDTHVHSIKDETLEVLKDLFERIVPPAVLLERDDYFQSFAELKDEIHRLQRYAVAC